jgi:hypothetical protein
MLQKAMRSIRHDLSLCRSLHRAYKRFRRVRFVVGKREVNVVPVMLVT